MGGFNMRVCALAACLLLAGQVSSYTMDDLCAQWSGSGYVGNPADCTGWGYCLGQKLVSWNTCKSGLVFNAQTSSCGFANSTICTTSAVATCNAVKSPMYVAVPDDCNKYGYCFGNGSIAYGNCGTGGVYAANSNACIWGPSCPQDSICRFMKNDIFVGDPNNCGSYLQCNNGYGTASACPNGLFFNAASGVCQATDPCTGGSGSSGGNTDSTYTVGQSVANACTNGSDTNFYVADSKTCYGYFFCASTDAEGIWNSCLTGTHFDPKTQKCVSPADYDCPYNRCGNVAAPFMAVANTNCKQYEICSNSLTANCPSSNPYYDEVHNICTTGALNYTICTTST